MAGHQDQDPKRKDPPPKPTITQYRFSQPVSYNQKYYIICTPASWKGRYYTYGLGTPDGVIKHPEVRERDIKRATREDLKAQEARKVARNLKQDAKDAEQKARRLKERAEEAEQKAEEAEQVARIARAEMRYQEMKQKGKATGQKAQKV
ncbi:MAG: hypothetical protein Q9164_005694 [Protoblastenia rupestris]